jgi:GT2 family glycosyltransferase
MNQNNKVCCIIVNWNTPDLTTACLKSLNTQALAPDTIVVCDNGSTDGFSSQMIRAWAGRFFTQGQEIQDLTAQAVLQKTFPKPRNLPKFVFIQNSGNQGFAMGNNLGVKWALTQQGYSYIWLLNPDTWTEADALQSLLCCAALREEVGIWGSTVCLAQQPDILQCAGGYAYTPWSSIIRPALGGTNLFKALNASNEPSLDYIAGASMFIKSRVLIKIGYLCEDYFLFYEELDLCSRAMQAGYELGWCRKSIVYHYGGTSFETQAKASSSRLRAIAYHETLSAFIYTRKFYPHLLPLTMLIRLWGKLYRLIQRRQLFLMSPVLRACRDFLTGKWNGKAS